MQKSGEISILKRSLFVGTIIILFLIQLFTLNSCAPTYEGWQTITIKNCGKIKIPGEWECVYEDDLIYIFDDDKLMMLTPTVLDRLNGVYYDKYNGQYSERGSIISSIITNIADYSLSTFDHNGEEKELYRLDVGFDSDEEDEDNSLCFFVIWDPTVTEDQIIAIGKSFKDKRYFPDEEI